MRQIAVFSVLCALFGCQSAPSNEPVDGATHDANASAIDSGVERDGDAPSEDSAIVSDASAEPAQDSAAPDVLEADSSASSDSGVPTSDGAMTVGDGGGGGSGGGGGAMSMTLSGMITRWPTTVPVPGLSAARLPLITVWFSFDGARWWMMDSVCNGGNAVRIAEGQLTLWSTACVSGARYYQIRIDEPTQRAAGTFARYPYTVSTAGVALAALPQMRVYQSYDGATWTSMHGHCASMQSFFVNDGSVSLRSTNCNNGMTRYQIAWAPAASEARQSSPRYPVTLRRAIDAAHLPLVTAWWRSTDTAWLSMHGQCVGGYNVALDATGVLLSGDNCTRGLDYAVAITP